MGITISSVSRRLKPSLAFTYSFPFMSQPYRVLIVDDEPPARDLIQVFVGRVPDLQCVGLCANAPQALDAIQRLKPDLVFLDIQMPQMTGMDLLGLRLTHQPDIILTTAYSDYALASYEYAVLDYLIKPIAFERFMQAIAKFRERQLSRESPAAWRILEADSLTGDEASLLQGGEDSVWLREEKRLLQIPYREILYVEGMKDYVKVFLADQMIMTHLSIGKAEALLQPPTFVRIHRSHIARRSAIRLIEGNLIWLINGTQLQIGPHYREALKQYISALR